MSLFEETLKELNWPDKKKSLFSSGKDWWNLAHLEIGNETEGFSIYAQSYKDAGDRLVEYAQSDKTSINFLVFPILFLYRHYLELALKEIIIAATQYLEKEHNDIYNCHELLKLWDKTKKLISEVEIDIPSDEMTAVENQIRQFDKLDERSQTFRYPVDKNGNVFKKLSEYINIENVKEIVNGLWAWCFGLVNVIGEYEDAKNPF